MLKSTYVIQCRARCVSGCHIPGTWRKSRRLPPMSWVRARLELWRHGRKYPNSGPYRLIRIEEGPW